MSMELTGFELAFVDTLWPVPFARGEAGVADGVVHETCIATQFGNKRRYAEYNGDG